MEARQKEKGKGWTQNDRLIAVATHARTHEGIKTLDQMRPHTLQDITAFFVDYNKLHGKKFEPIGQHGPHRGEKFVKQGAAAYKSHHHRR
jgi:inorganic pyrophosphatase